MVAIFILRDGRDEEDAEAACPDYDEDAAGDGGDETPSGDGQT